MALSSLVVGRFPKVIGSFMWIRISPRRAVRVGTEAKNNRAFIPGRSAGASETFASALLRSNKAP